MQTSDEAQKREALKEYFLDPAKVDRMSTKQVIAIYLRLKAQGKLR